MFYVYVIESLKNNKVYTGHTANLDKRLDQHNAGKTKSTKAFIPYKILFFELCTNRKEAIAREKYLKSGIGREFIKEYIRTRSSIG